MADAPAALSVASNLRKTNAADDAFEAWRRRRAQDPTTTIIDLYELVARPRGLEAHELPLPERIELGHRALHAIDPRFELLKNTERGHEPIVLVPYEPGWPAAFERWRSRFLSVMTARRIDHVGSTAVPGLDAKPTVDIQISVDDIEDEAAYVPAIESVGVQLRNRDSDHRYFRPFAGRPRDVHVHVCNAGGIWERRHLLFVEFLRTHAAARDDYIQAKTLAAARWGDDRLAYTEAKDAVIRGIMDRAEQWARETGWTP